MNSCRIAWCFVLILFSCGRSVENLPEIKALAPEDSLMVQSWFQQAMLQPPAADSILKSADSAVAASGHLREFYYLHLARYYIQTGWLDQADSVLSLAFDLFGADSMSPGTAKFYNLRGAVASYRQQHEAAVADFRHAIKIFERADDRQQTAAIKFNLANLFFSRLDFESAYKYSTEAEKLLTDLKDTSYLPLCKAIVSVAATNLEKSEVAAAAADEAMELSRKYNNPMGLLLANYALAEVAINVSDYDQALTYLLQTVTLAEQFRQYQILLPVRSGLLKVYLVRKEYREAIASGEEALMLAEKLNNEEVKYNLYKNLAYSYEGVGDKDKAISYLREAEQQFRDKLTANNQKVIQELLLKYEAEKKNNTILLQANKLGRQRNIIVVLLLVSVLVTVLLAGYRLYVRQRNRIQAEEKNKAILLALADGEEQERKRLAVELHDGVASNLIALKLGLENIREGEARALLQLVQSTHDEVRGVAHNLMPVDFAKTPLPVAIGRFCQMFYGGYVSFKSNTDHCVLTGDKSSILYRAVQEFVQNAQKHAAATEINVQFLQLQEDSFQISIEDNGKGFERDKISSTGLPGLIERLQSMNVDVDFSTAPGRGTSVFMNVTTR